MSQTVTNLLTGETLTVQRECGNELWLRNGAGEIEHALREHLPAERWRFDGASEPHKRQPRIVMVVDFPPLPELVQYQQAKARSAP